MERAKTEERWRERESESFEGQMMRMTAGAGREEGMEREMEDEKIREEGKKSP